MALGLYNREARREGMKILNGSTNGHANRLLGEIPGVPQAALLCFSMNKLRTLAELQARADAGHKGNLYKALCDLPAMKESVAKAAHSAILADRDAVRLNGHAPAPEERAPVLDAVDEPFRHLPIAKVRPWPGNPRKTFDEEELAKLGQSIVAEGILHPLLVRPVKDGYEIADGERRFRAASAAGVKQVPAIVRNLTDQQMLEIAVTTFEQRSDINPLEKAEAYARLADPPPKGFGKKPAQIAKDIGRSEGYVNDLLKLRGLPKVARDAAAAGDIPLSTAVVIARVPGEKTREKVALHVITGDDWWGSTPKPQKNDVPMSARDAQDFVHQHCTRQLKGARFDPKSATLLPEAGSCEMCPKRAGNLAKSDPEGYKGSRADLCTDPECFERKVAAWQQGVLAEASAKGQPVLTGKAAEQALSWQSRYYKLDDHCSADDKYRPYEQVLKGKLEPTQVTVACDDKGNVRRLVEKKIADPIIKKVCKRVPYESSRRGEQRAQNAKYEAGKVAARKANGLVADAAWQIFLRLDSITPADRERVRALVELLIDFTWADAAAVVVKRRGLTPKHNERRGPLQNLLADMTTPSQMLALAAEVAAARHSHGWGHPHFGEVDNGFWKQWSIDKAALMREAAAEKKAKGKK